MCGSSRNDDPSDFDGRLGDQFTVKPKSFNVELNGFLHPTFKLFTSFGSGNAAGQIRNAG